MLKDVVALAHDGTGAFGLGLVSDVFGYDRSDDGLPVYDFAVATERPGRVRTDTGLVVHVEHGLERAASADLVIVLGWEHEDVDPPAAYGQVLRAAVARGARVMSHCTGAFVVAASGIADGRTLATHWRHADALARRYPAVTVDRDVLYVDDDPVFSSAGSAAGIDTCLHLLRREHGVAVANTVARRLVVPPHRDGGQAQYVEGPSLPADDGQRLREVLPWALERLDQPLSVGQLAARAMTSPRSFARHFRALTGTTPHAWLLAQRVALAQQLLESTDLPVEEVARRSGFGAATTLRHHFTRRVSTSPQAYRHTFRGTPAAAGSTRPAG
ncbi:helix-turn-helix domain-containing protein [uncultured Pseudokineococcus sp.]|uniref:helix-turn-helix domain-containing protein n=1 Tax=uncultured Pseudokineococcus sp. TaxID=1642928 RepID=UPI00260F4EE0|nr:helix-turn-helix domain-containing protein [uncultured Pseudokineococcus sp.]